MNPKLRNVLIILIFVAISAALMGCGRKGDPLTPAPEATADTAETE